LLYREPARLEQNLYLYSMAGIYLHIPFCKKKCHYCDFFSLATTRYREAFITALHKEILLRKDYLAGETIETIYFGGGTPSLLSAETIQALLQAIRTNFKLAPEPEITLEANPDDLDLSSLQGFFAAGINRLSIGIQSFCDEDLLSLNRVHSGTQAIKCLHDAKTAGFQNISIDLIYGIPGLSLEAWKGNLDIFASLDIPHLSSYWLTIETGTALAGFIRKGKYPPLDEAIGAAHFNYLMEWAKANQFLHYEVSNYAREGCLSRHNTAYWQAVPYLGLGPSAHSYNGSSRQWNLSNLSTYIKGISEGETVSEEEQIDTRQRFNEYIMTSLRTMWGCDLTYIERTFGYPYAENTKQMARKYIEKAWLQEKGNVLFVLEEGWLQLDGMSAELFST